MTGIILLAAGEATRMGTPKQLLPLHGRPMVQHAVIQAVETALQPVVVVTGAHAGGVEPAVSMPGVQVVHNPHWQQGMASSIKAGLGAALDGPQALTAVIIMLCDQPLVTSTVLLQLQQMHQNHPEKIIACAYAGTAGVPALFPKTMFNDLLGLQGHEGARKLVMQAGANLCTVPFDGGATDLDTPDDYKKFTARG